MPLKIIRQDITKIKCDAIVNPTNSYLWPGGGVDEAIHAAAGPELFEYCQKIGTCSVGEAKITPAFNLPCKYIIHTAGPEWEDGLHGERVLLRSCYKEAMELAIAHACKSVAFPLISSGTYGYPKDQVLRVATEVISEYLLRYEADVYIVVYDKSAYTISKQLFTDITDYIDDNYVGSETHAAFSECHSYALPFFCSASYSCEKTLGGARKEKTRRTVGPEPIGGAAPDVTLDEMLRKMDKGFAETLFYYIDKKGITDVECYKRSNVGKKTFSKIKCEKNYRPSKVTAVSFAIGLHLSFEETEHLLSTAGMCLSHSSKFDVIIEYFVSTGNYRDIFDVNEVLYQFDQATLGV